MPKKTNPSNFKKISTTLILAIALGLTLNTALAISGLESIHRLNSAPKSRLFFQQSISGNSLQDAT